MLKGTQSRGPDRQPRRVQAFPAAGEIQLSITLAGFKAIKDQPVEVDQSTPPLDLSMEVGGIEEQVVVTATRTEAAVSQVGNSVSVVTRDELSRNGAVTMARP